MDDRGCPRCKTTKYRNPALKLMVNVCGHSLCESCVDMLFVKGSGSCPECGTALRRSNFRYQLLEDAQVEKEVDIRRRILKDFNKKEEDFATLREYDDYLEMVETIIYNMANHIDVEQTKRQIEQYKKDNKETIRKNLCKLSADDEYLEQLIEEEKEQAALRKQLLVQETKRTAMKKQRNKEALIDDLMFSDMPAQCIVESHKNDFVEMEVQETRLPGTATTFSSGIRVGRHGGVVPLQVVEEDKAYHYEPFFPDSEGPSLPDTSTVLLEGYVQHIQRKKPDALAGGFESHVACQRALHDALNGLLFMGD